MPPQTSQPDEPQGRDPRKAAALRGSIDRLVGANADRNARAEADCLHEKQLIDFRRRLLALVNEISRVTYAMRMSELETLSGGTAMGDFTIEQLHDHLLAKLPMHCPACGYYLKGLPAVGDCPECGAKYHTGVFEPQRLLDLLAAQLQLPVERLTPGMLVIERLRQLSGLA